MRAVTPRVRRVLIIGSWTFFLSVALNFGSISALDSLSLFPSILILLLIVIVGIVFDIIGTAAAAARDGAFSAMASERVVGSKEALRVVHSADSVASFCNDVVGDICGTLSGAVVATIVFQLVTMDHSVPVEVANTVLVALTAAVTVGGKAWGKSMAIHNYVAVLMIVGRLIHFVENTLGVRIALSLLSRRKVPDTKGKPRDERNHRSD